MHRLLPAARMARIVGFLLKAFQNLALYQHVAAIRLRIDQVQHRVWPLAQGLGADE
jgi:hypothetical protein